MNAKQKCIMNKLLIIYGVKETTGNSRKSNNSSNHINKNPGRNRSVIHNRILTVTMLVFIIILVVNACLAGKYSHNLVKAFRKRYKERLKEGKITGVFVILMLTCVYVNTICA